jgi:hypothetical protein
MSLGRSGIPFETGSPGFPSRAQTFNADFRIEMMGILGEAADWPGH